MSSTETSKAGNGTSFGPLKQVDTGLLSVPEAFAKAVIDVGTL